MRARTLSDAARHVVPPADDGGGIGAAGLRDAAALAALAESTLSAAVAAARIDGTPWRIIAEHLGIGREQAIARYGDVELTFRASLLWSGDDRWERPEELPTPLADDPEASAASLDAWVEAHRQPGEPEPLTAAEVLEGDEAGWVHAESRALLKLAEHMDDLGSRGRSPLVSPEVRAQAEDQLERRRGRVERALKAR